MAKKALLIFLSILFCFLNGEAQTITTPKEFFGFNLGDDYHLANYKQASAYFKKLASETDKVQLMNIGETEEGRDMFIAVVSSPENLKNIEQYKEISRKLARAEISEDEADKLVATGKPIVWINGGLHATETLPAQAIVQLYYELLSRNDAETKRILDQVVVLLCEVNPDGMDMVSDWYMRKKDLKKRSYSDIPFLYNKYVGHDNNRDFYMMAMKETQNISQQLFHEWLPQIVFDQHQSAPQGAIVAGPPYRDPFNYVYDPMVLSGIDEVGAAMINRLNKEEKPGYTRLRGASFNTWWNGGLRSVNYFHNMIGLLTETRGYPTPSEISVKPDRLIPDNNTPNPIAPQKMWHFKQALDYTMTIDFALLDYASRNGDRLLKNIYVMGKNSIKRGSRDNWTYHPKWKDSLNKIYKKGDAFEHYNTLFKDPKNRDPRGYIISADQSDFPTAIRFVNNLIRSGIKINKATSAFKVNGKSYPAGSYIIKTNQAFRPYILDMFESQHYPNDFQYPGGPPIKPYDATGWTLAIQMGVSYDKVLDDFNGPFASIPYGELQSPPSEQIKKEKGYLLSSATNNSYKMVNELLAAGIPVFRTQEPVHQLPTGSFYVPSEGYTLLKEKGAQLGIKIQPVAAIPQKSTKIQPAKIALYDRYGGYAPSGWVRWIFDQFHFNYDLVYPKDIDEGKLKDYDVVLFIDYGIPAEGKRTTVSTRKGLDLPEQYRHMLGRISTTKSIPAIKEYIENGGNVVTVGRNTRLAYHLKLPVTNALKVKNSKGKLVKISSNDYYVPSSILKVNLDKTRTPNWGLGDEVSIMFNNNPVFRINEGAKDIEPLAWFGNENPLISGWAWGASHLDNGVVAFKANMGKGAFYAFSPEITFRAQSWNTFKMLFNELYLLK